MIDAWQFALVMALCAALFSYLAYKIGRLHMYLSILNQCISDMLQQPRAAEAIAEATAERLIREGHVKDDRRYPPKRVPK